MHFDGKTYEPANDEKRLSTQLEIVKAAMLRKGAAGVWLTLDEMDALFEGRYSQTSISARLRDLRKPRFGGYVVERRRRAEAERGIHEYLVHKAVPDNRQGSLFSDVLNLSTY